MKDLEKKLNEFYLVVIVKSKVNYLVLNVRSPQLCSLSIRREGVHLP